MPVNRIQLQDALQKPYDRVLFSREVLRPVFGSSFTLNSSLVPTTVLLNKSESAAIDKVWIYGKIQLDDSTEVTCYEVLLQPTVRIEQSKVAIQQYVRKLLTAGQAALINFVPGRDSSPSGEMSPGQRGVWRLTLVAKDSVLTDKGVKEKTTNAKRYTFLLGPSETCKTAAERFEVLSTEKEITFQTLVNAFSVEKLSKAFFEEYTLHYQNFCDYLQESNYRKSIFNISFPTNATKQEKDKASKSIRDFVKKLLGRIVFLYFVQKKAWLGASDTNYVDGLGDFIKQLFNKSGGNDAFYCNWLTVLFFDTLNKERANDDFRMPDGKTVKVPFLNGGLFDKEEFDEHLLTFPSKLFHHPDFEDAILTAKNNGFARGFLDFLDAFNFTIYEDSPDDHTVAVDPEMLGHIFENLLEDNKDKGAFYTPKEIVHYMCQESLTEYCLNLDFFDCGISMIDEDKRLLIESIIKKKEVDFELLKKHCKSEEFCKSWFRHLEKHLDNVKICDPAIGSGAFPIGLLQEIFSIKELIAYETNKEWNPAKAKLNIIQNSIYGVDIEKGAVDIARLRFWLSLVVDDEKPKALPNLDFKIVEGDSLISKFDGEIVEIDWEIKPKIQTDLFGNENLQSHRQLLQALTDKQRKYFDPANKDKKALALEIRNYKIDVLVNQLELMIKTEGLEHAPIKTNYKDNKKFIAAQQCYLKTQSWMQTIAKLKRLKQNSNEPFNYFDWKLDFPEVLNPYLVNGNGGFDIVIANPPYVNIANIRDKVYRKHIQENYITVKNKSDLYSIFIEKSYFLSKDNAKTCFIYPKTWMGSDSFSKYREFITNNFKIHNIINLGYGVFENATVSTVITIFSKLSVTSNEIKLFQFVKNEKGKTCFIEQENKLSYSQIKSTPLYLFSFIKSISIKIKTKPLKELVDFSLGIKTSNDKKFIINYKKDDSTYLMLRGKNIRKYEHDIPSEYIWYKPNIMMKKVGAGPRKLEYFSQDKILIQGICNGILRCSYDTNKYLVNDKVHIAFNPKEYSLLVILAILNSTLMSFISKSMFGNYLEIKINQLELLPFPEKIDNKIEKSIVNLVNQRFNCTNRFEKVRNEISIDHIVYKLYKINFEEVKIIDPEFSLSKNEYESIKIE